MCFLSLQLLAKGWTVRGTVRSLKNREKLAHLHALGKALPGKLSLHEADLLQEGSFDEAVHGADYVFHTASPISAQYVSSPLANPCSSGQKPVCRKLPFHPYGACQCFGPAVCI